MSKLDVAVGDEFPLDEGSPDGRRGHRGRRHGRHRHGHGEHHHGHHHHHHRRHGFRVLAHLALLATIAGLIALIVAGKIPIIAAYGMVGVGAAVLVLMFVLHALWHRRNVPQPPVGTV